MNDEHEDDERKKQLERMRRLLTPISRERAREIADLYTKPMRDSIARTSQRRTISISEEVND